MHTVEIILLVLMLGAVTGVASRYLTAIPLPLIQITIGALLSWPQAGLHIGFDPELFLLLFIPPLLFADGWRIPKRELFGLHRPVLLLAFGLVFITVLGLGYLIHWLLPSVPLSVAFALAAVVSPTDAVAVSAITRNLGMPHKTMHILEGESLLNDASGLVALKFALAATITGSFSALDAARDFVWMCVGGLTLGALMGWGFSTARKNITRRLGDMAATQMVLLLVLLPFAVYLLAEVIGTSGILAAVAAGITTNMADLDRGEFIHERLQTDSTWSMVESAFNGAIFLLLGLQLPTISRTMIESSDYPWWELTGFVIIIGAALLLVRWLWLTFVVYGRFFRTHLPSKPPEQPPQRLLVATTFAGIRGAVTLAAALSFPLMLNAKTPFPARDLVVFLSTGVILFTLVLGSVALPLLLRGLPKPTADHAEEEERLARIQACQQAISSMAITDAEIAAHDEKWLTQHQEIIGLLTKEYRRRIEMMEAHQAEGEEDAESNADGTTDSRAVIERKQRYIIEQELRLRGLQAERRAIYAQRRKNLINDETMRGLVQEIDMAEISLKRRLAANRRQVA
ncbi:Na+/H+ antiporter [Kerstersia gyiorum]|uniref:Na+/H+ antiporter n=1 Tax=Kerstersia gyiorum TaxID=206506 RepID=UPI00209ECA08|nr:Na+/H+ antiporter [Kerstersia gyiorum]MCP1638207.1 CPA1 family monovalent cation:H+ antiporter [Kerstersia gyiorum]MCP1672541.1 CPA1 family monovalent cation:H+ antiporter [Kerstersia gyiorum]MCP1680522.1 CPA1 family monovalent cation:H+ antiporter [Kerstersia gyiorum]MCP1709053.1 CPA1 family monovalent cation:H+ antiporter [Kerstersia gyiorum]MCP1825175.1 CPA1 family monovalent cation:H+ antiporter [Kerstersia gyiorum]